MWSLGKNGRSVFEIPPDYFDTCRLLKSPHSSKTLKKEEEEEEELTVDDGGEEQNLVTESKEHVVRWSCNTCKAEFDSLFDQRFHFKSDFHRFNIKLSIAGKDIVKVEDFDELTSTSFLEDNDLSSISGSEDEAEKRNNTLSGLKGDEKQKVYVRLQDGETVSLWKCLILNDTENISFESEKIGSIDYSDIEPCLRESDVIKKLKLLTREPRDKTHLRVVLLAKGGHFAGCVFDGNSDVAHKTFHRYVIRAKAGSKQSSKDASGKGFHSAGASLRRYNELALKKEIGELLATWKPYFDATSFVFISAPSSNRQLLFDGEKPNFSCKRCFIRYIPLPVKRPTLKEAKRIYHLLTQVSDEVDDVNITSNEDKLPKTVSTKENSLESSQKGLVVDVNGRGAIKDEMDSKISDISVPNENESEVVCISTPLHEASKSGNFVKVLELLEQGLDPCAKDERGRTPYMVTNDKEVRNTFRRFMALNLDKWDWHAANVPSALTKELEEAQAAKQAEKDAKKKARAKELKKLRKAKEKKAQAEAALTQSSSSIGESNISKEEKLRMAQIEEREKRAAAAERRMAALSGTAGTTSSSSSSTPQHSEAADGTKCSCCRISLVGIVPFHRYNYKYCSTSCMHVHKEILEDG